jgi:hypothetical protein
MNSFPDSLKFSNNSIQTFFSYKLSSESLFKKSKSSKFSNNCDYYLVEFQLSLYLLELWSSEGTGYIEAYFLVKEKQERYLFIGNHHSFNAGITDFRLGDGPNISNIVLFSRNYNLASL